jgi:hypothetical protein
MWKIDPIQIHIHFQKWDYSRRLREGGEEGKKDSE